MDIIVENKYYYPDRNELSDIIHKTLKECPQKYENSPWYIDCKYNIQFFDKFKNNTKKLTTRNGPNRTIVASNGRYEYRQMNIFMISIEGEIKKHVVATFMKCYGIPMLWRKFFLNIANNRNYINNYCNRPLRKFDRHLRDWYLNQNPDDDEMRAFDENFNNYYIVFG